MSEPNKMDMPDEIWIAGRATCSGMWSTKPEGIDKYYTPVGPFIRADLVVTDNPPTVTAEDARAALADIFGPTEEGDYTVTEKMVLLASKIARHGETIRRCISHFIPEGE